MAYDNRGRHIGFGDPRLAYRPVRADGLDRNLRALNPADYVAGLGHRGLVAPCDLDGCSVCEPRR